MIALGIPVPPGLPAAPLGLPAGCIIAFAGEIGAPATPYVMDLEPWGWMVCDGRQLAIAQYPELFAVLGFRYLRAGESTALPTDPQQAAAAMFRIPDYRGTFLRAVNGSGGIDPDADQRTSPAGAASSEVGSVQQHALQNHEHFFPQVSQASGGAGGPVAGAPTEQGETVQAPQPADNAAVFFASKNETRPKNTYVYYLIRYSNGLHGLGAPQLPAMGPRLPGGLR
jgi:microcystin-dependent protein